MSHQQLVDYIREQISQGKSREDITRVLLENKWSEADIEESFRYATMSSLNTTPTTPPRAASLGVFKNFQQAWGLFQSRFGTISGIVLFSIVIGVSIVAVGVGILLAAGFTIGSFASATSLFGFLLQNGSLLITLVIVAVVIGFALSILSMWFQLATMFALKDAEERIGVIESYRRAWRALLSYWWILILTGLITSSGFLLFVIPGILFAVWFSFAGYILVAEKEKGLRALFKSREYVRGYWWKIGLNFIFAGLVCLLVYIGFTIILGILGTLPIPDVLLYGIDFIFRLLYPLFASAYAYVVYKNLKTIKGELVVVVSPRRKVWFALISLFPFFFLLFFIPFLMAMMRSVYYGGLNSNMLDTRVPVQNERID